MVHFFHARFQLYYHTKNQHPRLSRSPRKVRAERRKERKKERENKCVNGQHTLLARTNLLYHLNKVN
jgi:hypothetical protein